MVNDTPSRLKGKRKGKGKFIPSPVPKRKTFFADQGNIDHQFKCPVVECDRVYVTYLALKRHLEYYRHDLVFPSVTWKVKCPKSGCMANFDDSDSCCFHTETHEVANKEEFESIVHKFEETIEVYSEEIPDVDFSEYESKYDQVFNIYDCFNVSDTSNDALDVIKSSLSFHFPRGIVLPRPDFNENQISCYFPACNRVFSSITAYKYHCFHHPHSIEHMLELSSHNCDLSKFDNFPWIVVGLSHAIEGEIDQTFPLLFTKVSGVRSAKRSTPRPAPPVHIDSSKYEGFFSYKECISLSPQPEYLPAQYSDTDSFQLNVRTGIKTETPSIRQFQSKHIVSAKTTVLNVGGTITACAWAPTNSSQSYVALSMSKHPLANLGYGDFYDGSGSVQIWSVDLERQAESVLELLLFHEYGYARDIQWFPIATSDPKLIGTIACLFNDGVIRVFSIPLYSDQEVKPKIIKFDSSCIIKLQNNRFTCFSWLLFENSVWITTGSFSGSLGLWKLSNEKTPLLGTFCPKHNGCVKSISAISNGSSKCIVSSGMDGKILLTDLYDPFYPHVLFNHRFGSNFLKWSNGSNGFLCAVETENSLRVLKIEGDGMLGTTRTCNPHDYAVMDADSSPSAPLAASAGADGKIVLCQMGKKNISVVLSQFKMENGLLFWDVERKEAVTGQGDILFPPQVALQKISWYNQNGMNWVAVGSNTGLVLITKIN